MRRAWLRSAVVTTAVGMGWALGAERTEAVCRVVLPPVDSADPGVPFDPTTAAIYVWTPDVVVEWTCGASDADAGADLDGGVVPSDGGEAVDAGEGIDAAVERDGPPREDAGVPDPSLCPDGTPRMEISDTLLSLVVQPSILATGGTAGLVMPVPFRPDVSVGSTRLFEDAMASMRAMVEETVIVREDPNLGFQCSDPHYSSDATDVLAAAPLMLYGCDGDSGYADGGSAYYRPGTEGRGSEIRSYGDAGTVRYETFPSTDAYDVTVVNASSLEALTGWLDEHGFAHDGDDDAAFGAYVADDAWFVAVHVHPPATGEHLALAPLVVTWRGDELPITHRLQHDPRGGFLVTDALVIAPYRMGASDGSGWTEYAAPVELAGTSLEGFGAERGWLTRVTINRRASENVPDARFEPSELGVEVRPTLTRTIEAAIPAPCCEGGGLSTTNPAALDTFTYTRTYLDGESPPIPEEWLGRTPPLDAEWCRDGYGGWSGGSDSCGGSSSRPLRGCTTARDERWGAVVGGWGPIVLAVLWVVWRSRRR